MDNFYSNFHSASFLDFKNWVGNLSKNSVEDQRIAFNTLSWLEYFIMIHGGSHLNRMRDTVKDWLKGVVELPRDGLYIAFISHDPPRGHVPKYCKHVNGLFVALVSSLENVKIKN